MDSSRLLINARQLRVAPHALMFDPEFYLFDFSPADKITKFLLVEEDKMRLAPFIDIRFEPMAQGSFCMSTFELLALERQHQVRRQSPCFIFHHAFVCSTLVARCLDQIDAFFCLKEPWIMRRLADTKRDWRTRIPPSQWGQLFSTFMMLLARPYESGRTPVIKATNVANNLFPDVLKYLPGCHSLYLYSDLKSFLVSNLKKPQETRDKLPGLAQIFIRDEGFDNAFSDHSTIESLSFLQVCALTWAASLFNFMTNVRKRPSDHVRTLDAGTFLENPEESLTRLVRFFGHQPSTKDLTAMTASEVIETNSKQQHQTYGKQERARENELVLKNNESAIEAAIAWIDPVVKKQGILEFMQSRKL